MSGDAQDGISVPGTSNIENHGRSEALDKIRLPHDECVDEIMRELMRNPKRVSILPPRTLRVLETSFRILLSPTTDQEWLAEQLGKFLELRNARINSDRNTSPPSVSASLPVPPTTSRGTRVTRHSLKLAELAASASIPVEDDISRTAGLQYRRPPTPSYPRGSGRESSPASLSSHDSIFGPHDSVQDKKRSRDHETISSSSEDWRPEFEEDSTRDDVDDRSFPPNKKAKRSPIVLRGSSEQSSIATSYTQARTRVESLTDTAPSPEANTRLSVDSFTSTSSNEDSGLEYSGDQSRHSHPGSETEEAVFVHEFSSSDGEKEEDDMPPARPLIADQNDPPLFIQRQNTPAVKQPLTEEASASNSSLVNSEKSVDACPRITPLSLRRAMNRRQSRRERSGKDSTLPYKPC